MTVLPWGLIVAVGAGMMPWQGAGERPPLEEATVVERHGAGVPPGLRFRDENGKETRLEDHLADGVPVILVPADYDCGMLCGLTLDGLARGMQASGLRPEAEYRIVAVGIDPRDGPEMARGMAERIGARVRGWGGGRAGEGAEGVHVEGVVAPVRDPGGAPVGWSFLVGDEGAVRSLMAAIGFGYGYDPATDQYSHPAVAVVLTPEGRVSSYLYGIEFPEATVRRALAEAARGGTLSGFDRVLLRCYRYLPALRRYDWLIRGLLTTVGAFTILALGMGIGWLTWRGRPGSVAGMTGREGMRR